MHDYVCKYFRPKIGKKCIDNSGLKNRNLCAKISATILLKKMVNMIFKRVKIAQNSDHNIGHFEIFANFHRKMAFFTKKHYPR
jgi:hypothetical protein